jgi:uncharacterized protein (DUF934 family)
MPRRLLRDGEVVADDWLYAHEAEDAGDAGLILTLDAWLSDRERWSSSGRRLGVILAPVHKVEQLAPDLARFALVGAQFPGPSDGRGYTQGQLRATGYVRRDQLFFLARCGFNSFELAESEIETACAALATFSAAYQPANDAGLALKLRHR